MTTDPSRDAKASVKTLSLSRFEPCCGQPEVFAKASRDKMWMECEACKTRAEISLDDLKSVPIGKYSEYLANAWRAVAAKGETPHAKGA